MKILIAVGAYPSKSYELNSIFVHMQVKALRSRGVDVAVFEVDMRSLRKNRRLGFYKEFYEGVPVYRMFLPCGPIPGVIRILSKLATNYGIKKVLADYKHPDLIHCHFVESSCDFHGIKQKYKLKEIITEHRCIWLTGGKFREKRKIWAKRAYQESDRIIAVSQIQNDEIFKLCNKKPFTIPNIIDKKFYYKNIEKYDNFTFVSVGNMQQRKRFDLTIKAFQLFHSEHPTARLVLVGGGEIENELKKLTKEYEIDHYVKFTGKVNNSEMPDIYNKCHAFLLPSEVESFGVVYAEAAACGVPIIATDCGGPSDIVNEGNGIIVEKDNAKVLYNAMKYVFEHYNRYDSQLISLDIIKRFGEETIANQLIAMYGEVLKQKGI